MLSMEDPKDQGVAEPGTKQENWERNAVDSGNALVLVKVPVDWMESREFRGELDGRA